MPSPQRGNYNKEIQDAITDAQSRMQERLAPQLKFTPQSIPFDMLHKQEEEPNPYGYKDGTVAWRPGDPLPNEGTPAYDALLALRGTVDNPKQGTPDRVIGNQELTPTGPTPGFIPVPKTMPLIDIPMDWYPPELPKQRKT